jgi:hypothetical protein
MILSLAESLAGLSVWSALTSNRHRRYRAMFGLYTTGGVSRHRLLCSLLSSSVVFLVQQQRARARALSHGLFLNSLELFSTSPPLSCTYSHALRRSLPHTITLSFSDAYMYVYMRAHTSVHTSVHTHTHIYIYERIFTLVYICTHTRIHIHTHAHTHTYANSHTHTHIYMHTHTHSLSLSLSHSHTHSLHQFITSSLSVLGLVLSLVMLVCGKMAYISLNPFWYNQLNNIVGILLGVLGGVLLIGDGAYKNALTKTHSSIQLLVRSVSHLCFDGFTPYAVCFPHLRMHVFTSLFRAHAYMVCFRLRSAMEVCG